MDNRLLSIVHTCKNDFSWNWTLSEKIKILSLNFEKFVVSQSCLDSLSLGDKLFFFVLLNENQCWEIEGPVQIGPGLGGPQKTGKSRIKQSVNPCSRFKILIFQILCLSLSHWKTFLIESRKLPKRDWLGLNSNEYPCIHDISHDKFW